MILNLLLCMALDTGFTTIQPDDIYEPVRRGEVALADDGSIFVLNHKGKKVLHYGPDGTLKRTLGTAGDGPGEFGFPLSLSLIGDRLYVFDGAQGAFQIFKTDGSFIDRVRIPNRRMEVVRMENGWIGATLMSMNPDEPIDVYWLDETMEEQTKIGSWPKPKGATPGLMVRRTGGGVPTAPFNPVRDRPDLVADRDGRFAYLYPGGGFRIAVIDGRTKKVAGTIKRDTNDVPFNEDYGMKLFEEFKEQNKRMAVRIKFEPKFPESFPPIRELFITADNHLAVRLWTGNPEKRDSVTVISADGKDGDPAYKTDLARRILFIRNNKACLNIFDPEDEKPVLMWVPLEKLEQTAEEHPYDEDAEEPRLMVRHG
ncbi:MAG: hypothetical protein QNK37_09545 [Acidobacteriota bacterium]|nr:hypothetical protein [Acidobacteriota bacterium]